jgi:serine/threonine protein kinase
VHRDIKPENMLLQRVPIELRSRSSERIGDKEEDSTIILKVCDLGQCRKLEQGKD